MTTEFAGWLAAGIAVLAFWRGVRQIRNLLWHPNVTTWIIWTGIDVLLVVQSYLSGARATIWQLVAYTAGAAIIAKLAISYGDKRFDIWDKLCVAGACLGIIVWWSGNSPQMGLVFTIIAHLLGTIPTYRNVWANPEKEDSMTWFLFFLGSIALVAAVGHWSWSAWPVAIWPAYEFIACATLWLLAIRVKLISVPSL